jgi:arginyl-tRNA synthetase
VIRQNHLGDWGTQFGMLLEHLLDTGWNSQGDHTIGDLNLLYQVAKARFDAEPEFQGRARRRVVSLQAGEPAALALWQQLIDESVRHMNDVYAKLGVLLTDADIRPESFYNPKLKTVLSDLQALGIVTENQSAQVAFPPGFQNKEGEPLPMIVQKSDGGFGYAATDLAAARFRVGELGANRIIIVADARQSEHFQMLFAVLRQAQWLPSSVRIEHVSFGTIQGADRKPFATRAGGTVRLVEVLDEAISRARKVLDEKGTELDDDVRDQIANAVGVGAVKYADLCSERVKDYVFDYDRMLALEGNTAPYLQNAYVRIQSIFRKGGVDQAALVQAPLLITEAEERALALRLFQLPAVLQGVSSSLEPHRLCNYLYELAAGFHTFYEHCRVLNASDDTVRQSRLRLCDLVARTLKLGLGLLGISAVAQM